MAGNVAIETVIGAVPIVGDLFDILEGQSQKRRTSARPCRECRPFRSIAEPGRALVLVPVMLAVLVLLALSIAVVALVFRFVFG